MKNFFADIENLSNNPLDEATIQQVITEKLEPVIRPTRLLVNARLADESVLLVYEGSEITYEKLSKEEYRERMLQVVYAK